MARPLRIEYPGAWYHVMNRGRRAENIFVGRKDYYNFIDLLKESCELWNINISAYCLMSNHYHLLIQTPEANLSRCMRHINGVYTQRFNKIHNTEGQLFRGRYKSILVEEDRYLLQLVRYIHKNPLRANLVKNIDMYLWSSHKAYQSKAKKWDWLYKDYILNMLSKNGQKRKLAYQQFISKNDSTNFVDKLEGKQVSYVIGSDKFSNWVKDTFFAHKEDIEIRGSTLLAPSSQTIKKSVCKFYGVKEERLKVSERGIINEPRNVSVYLTRLLRKDKLSDICHEYSMARYSTASSIIERVRKRMITDQEFRNRIDAIKSLIMKTKGQSKT